MVDGSSTSTDVKVLLQSLITVVIIAAVGYFGMTFLGPRLAGLQPQSVQQPTLQAYSPPPEGGDSSASEGAETVSEGAPEQGRELAPGGAEPSVEEAATLVSGAGRSAGERSGQGPSALQTSIAMGTPMPEGGSAGRRPQGDSAGAELGTGVRLTAIAEGTIAPPALSGDGDGQPDIAARMTAIAQGTFAPGAQLPAETPAAPQAAATGATLPGNTSESSGSSNGPATSAPTESASGASDLAQRQTASTDMSSLGAGDTAQQPATSATDGTSASPGERLFAVTRGAGAGLYDRPDGDMISELMVGSALVAMARSEDGQWAFVQSNDNVGWVPLDQLVLFDAESLPVISETQGGDASVSAVESMLATPTSVAANAAEAPPAVAQTTPGPGSVATVAGEYIEPVLATVISQYARLNVRSGPGTDFNILARANPGEELIALARTPLNDWIQVALPETEQGVGWVAADFVDLSDRVEALPAASIGGANSPPVELPTPTPVVDVANTAVSQPNLGDAGIAASTPGATRPAAEGSTADGSASALVLRQGPGSDFDVETEVDALPEFLELQRSADNAWALVALLGPPGSVGWVSTEQLELALNETRQEVTSTGGEELAVVDQGQAQGEAEAVSDGALSATLPSAAGAAPVVATVITEGALLRVRSGPGTDYDILDRVAPGQKLAAMARSDSGDWLQISLDNSGDQGWVASSWVELDVPIETLNVAAAEQAPSADLAAQEVTIPSQDAGEQDSIGPPEFLPTAGANNTATAAADFGGTLVFESSNGGQIYGYNLETGGLWPISVGFDPAISPDGKLVAFTRDGGEKGLYLVGIDGSNERLIFSGGQRLASPKWSPDGLNIVFSHGVDAYECIPLGPGGCVPIDALGDRPLPDGITPSTWVNYHLSVVDVNGDDYRDLATLESARAPDWNEAGIVYQSSAGLQLTSDDANATNQLIINDYLKPYFHDPDWQPGGGLIVYQGKEASHWELFSVRPDGSGVTALTRPKTALVNVLPSNVAPAWNPEGEAVVFLSNRTENGEAGEWRLWAMEADGSNQQSLQIDVPLEYTFGDEQIVSWGPSAS